jgi:hypothetical protein
METNYENGYESLNDATRHKLKKLSQAFLRFHKTLLEDAKAEYEAVNGKIPNPNVYLSLVLDDPHFAWLRKISALIALIDEASSVRRPATQPEALALIKEANILLKFEDKDEFFNNKLQNALQKNPDAVVGYNETLLIIRA